jgi:PleD family two-component response regulator
MKTISDDVQHSTVGGLIASDALVAPQETVNAVAERFFGSGDLEALAVVDGGAPVGLVTRTKMKRKKVMIIDDNEEVLQVTRDLLEHEGYDVVTHQHGFGATSAIRANRPDLVLLDINMPALSGENLAPLIHANRHTERVPIIFYSSNDEDALLDSVKRLGVADYICKGNISELRVKVRRYAGRDGAANERSAP